MQNTPLNEYEESVLRVIQSRRLTHEQLMEEFSSPTRLKATVVRFIGSLLEREYIRKAKRLKGAYVIPLNGDIPDGLFEEEEVYELTPLGMNFLAKSTAMFTSFNNISNSNIANHSPHANQTLEISSLDPAIKNKVADLERALKERDGKKAGKAIEYIFDKSADVAVSLIAQVFSNVLTGGQS